MGWLSGYACSGVKNQPSRSGDGRHQLGRDLQTAGAGQLAHEHANHSLQFAKCHRERARAIATGTMPVAVVGGADLIDKRAERCLDSTYALAQFVTDLGLPSNALSCRRASNADWTQCSSISRE